MKRDVKLFWRVMRPLAVTFALLWLGIMAVVIQWTCQRLEGDVEAGIQRAETEIDRLWENYQVNQSEERAAILRVGLNHAAQSLSDLDGGMALMIWAGGREFRTQLTWGYGRTEDVNAGTTWYLDLDSGLDDAGRTALTEWIVENRDSRIYELYPLGSRFAPEDPDGTYARATGWAEEGNILRVKSLQLIHPDGSVETVVETDAEGEPTHTVELRYLELNSGLLSSWYWSDNTGRYNGPVDIARRLANYREAQAILDRELAGEERSVLKKGGALRVSTSDDERWLYRAYHCPVLPSALKQNVPLYASTLILAVLVLLGLSRHLSRRVTGPVEALSARAAAGEPCPEDGEIRELNTLAAAVNTGRGRLEEQLARERAFTRAAAHELKTPLAVLRAHGEALKEDIDPARRGEYLDVVLSESDRMAALVGRLLDLSRLEGGGPPRREPVRFAALVGEVFTRLALPMEQKGLHVTRSLQSGEVWGDRARLERAVEELAANALRYTPAGGAVSVRLARRGEALRLTVDNDGANFTTEELAHLWEPFYRGDPSRSRSTGGAGLGLAMVKAAVEAQGGRCGAENRSGGVRFWLELPSLQSDG